MGVTNRNEVHYKNPECVSSTESLHIPNQYSSNDASLESIPVHIIIRRRREKRQKTIDEPTNSPRNAGRRRQRRFKAVAELYALIEEEEPEMFLEDGIPHNSLFTTVVENPDLGHIWEQLTADDESSIHELLDRTSKTIVKSEPSYKNVSFRIKMTFKMMRSLNELERTEAEITSFFTNTPKSTYINSNKSSFQRLLIHGIAQYYCLKSASFNTEDGKRSIKVENPKNVRNFNQKPLFSIVEDNHGKRV